MKWFNENMTYPEFLSALWKALEGKSKEEQAEVWKEHDRVIPIITAKELDRSNTLTEYVI